MKKKILLVAAAGLLTTATLIAATAIRSGKPAKTAVAKEKKADYLHERTHCFD